MSTASANAAALTPPSTSRLVFVVSRKWPKPLSSASPRKALPTSSATPAASRQKFPSVKTPKRSPSKSPITAAAWPFRTTAILRVPLAWVSAFPACANGWPSSVVISKSIPILAAPPFALAFFSPPPLSRTPSMNPLRLLIADDHAVVRAGLRALLESHKGWEVCAEPSDGREAVEKAAKFKPDILILDIGMPLLNGVEAARRIHKSLPNCEILILTMHQSDELVQQVVDAGARGYILKDEADRVLLAAVDAL